MGHVQMDHIELSRVMVRHGNSVSRGKGLLSAKPQHGQDKHPEP